METTYPASTLNDGVHLPRLSRTAWLPVPILFTALIVFWAADWQGSHESVYLLLLLNLHTSTLVCLFVAYLIARSFLVRATPGLLLLGCGVVIWGPAGVVATAVAHGDANTSITVYNSCVWLSALCHLAGVSLSLRPRRALFPPALWLSAAYVLAGGAVALVALSARAGWIPTFFVEDRGGAPVRQVVLFSAMMMFIATAVLLRATSRRSMSVFVYWYALALTLIAVGLLGVMLQRSHASVLGWTGRLTQSLGGIYMLIAAVASVRESRVWGISLEAALDESEERYRALFETAPDAMVVHRDGRFLRANGAALALLGADSFEQLARHTVLDFFRPQDRDRADERMRMAMAGNRLPTREATLLRLDGQEAVVEFHTASVDFQGTRTILTIIRDVTERRRTQESLRQSEENARRRTEELAALMDLAPAAIWVSNDPFCQVITGNRTANEFCEARTGANVSAGGIGDEQDFTRRFFQDSRELCPGELPMQRSAATGVEVQNTEVNVLTPSGRTLTLFGNASPLFDAQGRVRGSISAFVDITERKRAEELLRELNTTLEAKVAERTAELEHRATQLQRLTLELSQAEDRERRRIADLLHEDLQQHLAGTRFHLNLLRRRARADSPEVIVAEIDEMLKHAIEKSRGLCHDLSPAVLHMNDLSEVMRFLAKRAQTRHGLTVHVDVPRETVLRSEALSMFLFRVAQEMLCNVVKHAGVSHATLRLHWVRGHLRLLVADKGQGFDPTTLGETTGFGLLSIRERVRLLGGRMKIHGAEGRGSAVLVMIPDSSEGDGKRPAWKTDESAETAAAS